jgi:hypothetical protein
MTFMATDKISFRVVGRIFVARACVCKEQKATTMSGASFFTKVAKPDILPSVAGTPSVQRFSFQSNFCLPKSFIPFPKRRRP